MSKELLFHVPSVNCQSDINSPGSTTEMWFFSNHTFKTEKNNGKSRVKNGVLQVKWVTNYNLIENTRDSWNTLIKPFQDAYYKYISKVFEDVILID